MKTEYTGVHLTYDKQIKLFKDRRMMFKDEAKVSNKMKFINYYKIKEFSHPFIESENKYKAGTYFEDITDKFYFDKNLRLARNLATHNSNIIDIEFTTKLKIRETSILKKFISEIKTVQLQRLIEDLTEKQRNIKKYERNAVWRTRIKIN